MDEYDDEVDSQEQGQEKMKKPTKFSKNRLL